MPWHARHNITVVRHAHLSSAFGASPSAASSRFVVSSSRSDIALFARAVQRRGPEFIVEKKTALIEGWTRWLIIEGWLRTTAGASFSMVATDISLWSDDRTFQENVDQLLVGIPTFGFLLAQCEFARRGRH